jgi:hypothetical protein
MELFVPSVVENESNIQNITIDAKNLKQAKEITKAMNEKALKYAEYLNEQGEFTEYAVIKTSTGHGRYGIYSFEVSTETVFVLFK